MLLLLSQDLTQVFGDRDFVERFGLAQALAVLTDRLILVVEIGAQHHLGLVRELDRLRRRRRHAAEVVDVFRDGQRVLQFLRRVHLAATDAGMKKITVDLTELRFMNSSSIRSLVDWVEWIRKEPEARRYRLVFVTKPDVTWQQTTMAAIRAFGGEHVSVQNGV